MDTGQVKTKQLSLKSFRNVNGLTPQNRFADCFSLTEDVHLYFSFKEDTLMRVTSQRTLLKYCSLLVTLKRGSYLIHFYLPYSARQYNIQIKKVLVLAPNLTLN